MLTRLLQHLLRGVGAYLQLSQQSDAVIFPAQRKLERQRAQRMMRISEFSTFGVAEPVGDDGAALTRSQVGGNG